MKNAISEHHVNPANKPWLCKDFLQDASHPRENGGLFLLHRQRGPPPPTEGPIIILHELLEWVSHFAKGLGEMGGSARSSISSSPVIDASAYQVRLTGLVFSPGRLIDGTGPGEEISIDGMTGQHDRVQQDCWKNKLRELAGSLLRCFLHFGSFGGPRCLLTEHCPGCRSSSHLPRLSSQPIAVDSHPYLCTSVFPISCWFLFKQDGTRRRKQSRCPPHEKSPEYWPYHEAEVLAVTSHLLSKPWSRDSL